MGQAAGPVVYGFGYTHGSLEWLMFLGAAVVLVIAFVCARYLRFRKAPPPPPPPSPT